MWIEHSHVQESHVIVTALKTIYCKAKPGTFRCVRRSICHYFTIQRMLIGFKHNIMADFSGNYIYTSYDKWRGSHPEGISRPICTKNSQYTGVPGVATHREGTRHINSDPLCKQKPTPLNRDVYQFKTPFWLVSTNIFFEGDRCCFKSSTACVFLTVA